MIQLYCVQLSHCRKDYERFIPLITKDRQDKLKRLRGPKKRLECVVSGMLIRNYVFTNGKRQVLYNEFGKPYVKGGKHFNISHSGDYVIIALSEKPVGVDIEMHKEHDYMRLSQLTFHENEQRLIEKSNNRADDFFMLWTLKEAYMKLVGRGFNLSPKSFFYTFENNISVSLDDKNRCVFKVINDLAGYTVSVCGYEEISDNINVVQL